MLKKLFLSERFILLAILINAAVIFFISFPFLQDEKILLKADHFFVILFTVEAIVKIAHFGWSEYIKSNWNKFDFTIVVFSLPPLLCYWCLDIPNFSSILILRLFRLARLIRIVRIFHFVPNLKQLVLGLIRALKASLLVVAALLIFNFILAVLTCHLFGELAPQYFNDPLISFFTIFQMFTLEGWNEVPEAIALKTDYVTDGLVRVYFMLVVLSGGIFGMSLANAIFVDEMTIDNNIVLEEKVDQLQEQLNHIQALLERQTNDK